MEKRLSLFAFVVSKLKMFSLKFQIASSSLFADGQRAIVSLSLFTKSSALTRQFLDISI